MRKRRDSMGKRGENWAEKKTVIGKGREEGGRKGSGAGLHFICTVCLWHEEGSETPFSLFSLHLGTLLGLFWLLMFLLGFVCFVWVVFPRYFSPRTVNGCYKRDTLLKPVKLLGIAPGRQNCLAESGYVRGVGRKNGENLSNQQSASGKKKIFPLVFFFFFPPP